MRHALMAGIGILALSACLSENSAAPTQPLPPGSGFAVLSIDGQPAPEGVTFQLSDEDRISGRAPCNNYMASLTRSKDGIAISPGASTRMACLDPDRAQAETRFLAALPEITAAAPGPGPGQVILSDKAGATRLLLGPPAAE